MLTTTDSEGYPADGIVPPIKPTAPWRVAEVRSLQNYRLHVRFIDGTEGTVDMNARVHSAKAGVFSVLADVTLFNQVGLEYGAVTWPGEIDLAPDAMYDEIKAHGEWVLR